MTVAEEWERGQTSPTRGSLEQWGGEGRVDGRAELGAPGVGL